MRIAACLASALFLLCSCGAPATVTATSVGSIQSTYMVGYATVREFRTTYGMRCVTLTNNSNVSITCDWSVAGRHE